MLIFNPNLVSLTEQQAIAKQKAEEAKREEDAINRRIDAAKELQEKILQQKEDDLIKQVNALYARETFKFTAHISENKENIELYSGKNLLVGLFTKKQNSFIPLDLRIIGLSKAEDLILGRTRQHFYNIMEKVFS